MGHNIYASLNDKDLLKGLRKNKSYKIYDAVIVGFLIGVASYSTVANGFGLLTFLPLLYLPVDKKNRDRYPAAEKIAKESGFHR